MTAVPGTGCWKGEGEGIADSPRLLYGDGDVGVRLVVAVAVDEDGGGKPSMMMMSRARETSIWHASPEHYLLSDVGYKRREAMKSYESIAPYLRWWWGAPADYGCDQTQPLARLSPSSPYPQLDLSSEVAEEEVALGPRKKSERRFLFSQLPDSSRGQQLVPPF